MVLYPNKLPESERVCSGICSIIIANAPIKTKMLIFLYFIYIVFAYCKYKEI